MEWAVTLPLTLPSLLWGQLVDRKLPEPYLDEVFHIPQAQRYCQGDLTWDSKITTPPGLYGIAAALSWIVGCSTTVLRAENGIILWLLIVTVLDILRQRHDLQKGSTSASSRWNKHLHNAINIALFPPLVFFSGLYYTDVASTYATLLFWKSWIKNESPGRRSLLNNVWLCLLGLHSLLYRQTNIFWVAIFPLALSVLHSIDHGPAVAKQSMVQGAAGFGDTWLNIIRTSWKMGVVYDPPVDDALIDDYLKCIISIITCAISTSTEFTRVQSIFNKTLPYLVLLALFVTFILWNGSVVLGDKNNHVATIHLPQMLYIWPYFIFFSWPLVLPHVISWPLHVLDRARQARGSLLRGKDVQTILLILTMASLAAITIRYNTIIHPFTLADNRHYTFYVFRLLMRPWWMRYAVIPVYLASAWLCIQGLGNGFKKEKRATDHKKAETLQPSSTVTISFVLIWLITSALQLITAPLVEPRYFILPWMFWRLHVPVQAEKSENATVEQSEDQSAIAALLRRVILSTARHRLSIETAWLITINVVTGYIFLQWTFTWPSEPGKLQRFMW